MTAVRLAAFAALACLAPVSAWLVGQAGVEAAAYPGGVIRVLYAALRGLWISQALAAVLLAPALAESGMREAAAAILVFWLVPLPLLALLWAGGIPSGPLGLAVVLGPLLSAGLVLAHRGIGRVGLARRAEARAILTLGCAFALWRFREGWLALAGL